MAKAKRSQRFALNARVLTGIKREVINVNFIKRKLEERAAKRMAETCVDCWTD